MQIFHNAVVYTGDDFTDAFAVEDGRFVAIGADALALQGERIDLNGAFASFEEHTKGKIVPGHFADFVVLVEDMFRTAPAKIKDIPILQTWLEGKQVW